MHCKFLAFVLTFSLSPLVCAQMYIEKVLYPHTLHEVGGEVLTTVNSSFGVGGKIYIRLPKKWEKRTFSRAWFEREDITGGQVFVTMDARDQHNQEYAEKCGQNVILTIDGMPSHIGNARIFISYFSSSGDTSWQHMYRLDGLKELGQPTEINLHWKKHKVDSC